MNLEKGCEVIYRSPHMKQGIPQEPVKATVVGVYGTKVQIKYFGRCNILKKTTVRINSLVPV